MGLFDRFKGKGKDPPSKSEALAPDKEMPPPEITKEVEILRKWSKRSSDDVRPTHEFDSRIVHHTDAESVYGLKHLGRALEGLDVKKLSDELRDDFSGIDKTYAEERLAGHSVATEGTVLTKEMLEETAAKILGKTETGLGGARASKRGTPEAVPFTVICPRCKYIVKMNVSRDILKLTEDASTGGYYVIGACEECKRQIKVFIQVVDEDVALNDLRKDWTVSKIVPKLLKPNTKRIGKFKKRKKRSADD